MGRTLGDGQRVLGDHKTFRGFASGLIVGTIVGLACSYIFSKNLLIIAVAASFGALCGDVLGALLKRRLKIAPGGALPIVDQLDFVVGAVLCVSLLTEISLGTIMILFLVTPPIHLLTNIGAYLLGLKDQYW